MRRSTLVGGLAAALASMILVLPPPPAASAAPGDGSGALYADLYVVLRDVDGVPITTSFDTTEGPLECVQPISYDEIPGISTVENPVDGRDVYKVPLVGDLPTTVVPAAEEEEEAEPCDPQPDFAIYVSEVDLERLNLARTSDEVLDRKIAEVKARLVGATEITLDGAGRITTDGTPIDASPEHAAIYRELMETFTIDPGLDPAQIAQGDGGFDEWMLAAASIGAAAGKTVPITHDTVQYYNRISSPDPGGVGEWAVDVLPTTVGGEQFVDYTGFEYTRSEVFEGCTTWLDVPTLTWKSGPILDRVPFGAMPPVASGDTVTNLAGFTRLADDVRAVVNYLHENEVVVDPVTGEGFFIDPVFQESCAAQAEKVVELNQPVDVVDPAVTITEAPAASTIATEATFAFTATDAASVLCVLDAGAIERCVSPTTYTGLEPGTHTFNVIAMGVAGNFASATHTWEIVERPFIVPLTPVRLADTRPGFVSVDGRFTGAGPVPSGGMVEIPVAGRGGVPLDAEAAVVNLTITGAVTNGYATAFPCGTRPPTSSINFQPGESIANELVAKLSSTGTVCVYVHRTAHVVLDVAGHV